MTHSEQRSTPFREFLLASFGGALYGASHTLSGHPLDNLKTAMSLDPAYRNLSSLQSARLLYRTHGLHGFWRGVVPPLVGSSFYRSVMISTYEMSYTYFATNHKHDPDSVWMTTLADGWIPRPFVFASAVASALSRAAVEAPFEQAKVMRQTGSKWTFSADLYRGAAMQTARTTGLLVLIFGPLDVIRVKSDFMKGGIINQWLATTVVCTASYTLIWPLETLKNATQAAIPSANATLTERVEHLGGLRGLYRGALPGIVGGGMRNGIAMAAMANMQKFATALGLRDTA
jgi:solute carrier family 25 carnitine/acylcarnitine transporter 20/29